MYSVDDPNFLFTIQLDIANGGFAGLGCRHDLFFFADPRKFGAQHHEFCIPKMYVCDDFGMY
jgi:hypothetical protein